MFKTMKRIIDWCGELKGRLYAGFVFSFFSHIFAAMPLMVAAYTVGLLIDAQKGGAAFDTSWIWKCIVIQIALVLLRFLFDYLRARYQESIGYELTARDRLAVGSPVTALIALAAAGLSFLFLLVISHYAAKNAPVEAKANRDMTGAILEYARGLAVVKSFGKSGASMDAVKKAVGDSRRIHLKIEWGYLPASALHLLALKCGSVGLALAASLMCLNERMDFSMALVFIFFSFSIFASLEPISDSAHTLSVIDDAMDQLDALRGEHLIDAGGKDIPLEHYDIEFSHVSFGYDSRQVLNDVSFTIPEKTSTAIVGPSGSGKTTHLQPAGALL